MPTTTVLISSAGTSRVVALDYMCGGPVSVRLTSPSTTASASAGGVLQYTFNDIQAAATLQTTTAVLWSGVSSTPNSTVAALVLTSSQLIDVSYVYTFQNPVAALRFSCSAFSSGGILMDVIQGRSF